MNILCTPFRAVRICGVLICFLFAGSVVNASTNIVCSELLGKAIQPQLLYDRLYAEGTSAEEIIGLEAKFLGVAPYVDLETRGISVFKRADTTTLVGSRLALQAGLFANLLKIASLDVRAEPDLGQIVLQSGALSPQDALTFLRQINEENLNKFLLLAGHGDLFPFASDYDLRYTSPAVYLHGLFRSLPSPVWALYCRSLYQALKGAMNIHDSESLQTFLPMTALARIRETIPDLIDFLRVEKALDLFGMAVTAIATFDDDLRVQTLFEEFLFHAVTPVIKRHSAFYLNLLCRADPEHYPKYLAQFMQNVQGLVRDDIVTFVLNRLFMEILPSAVIDAHFSELDADMQRRVTQARDPSI